MFATLRYLTLTAIRDRLFATMMVALAILSAMAAFIGGKTMIEMQQSTVTFVAFSCRLVVIVGLVLFATIHIRRCFENREILLLLSRPISRVGFVLSYWVSLTCLALMLVLPATVMVWIAGHPPLDGLIFWSVSLFLEAMLLLAVTLFFALSLNSILSSAFGTLGFYILARMIGSFVAISTSEFRSKITALDSGIDQIIATVALVMPRLDLFGRAEWLIHGLDATDNATLPLVMAQSLVYTALILSASVFDFQRKRF